MKGQTSFSGAALKASVSIAALLIGGAAVAQTTPAPAAMPAAEPAVDVLIQVIGTRVVRDGYQAPTPVSVVTVDELQKSATPNIADFVNTLPAVSGSSTPRTTVAQVGAGRQGINAINLRGIGVVRTLTLLNGRRVAGMANDGTVDVGQLPQLLVNRVDVVTGGASAS